MSHNHFEVVYIDKFDDAATAALKRERIRRRFGLSQAAMARLSSGSPVVVKKQLDLSEAKRYREAIQQVGGVCWVQALDAEGKHRERRQSQRRRLLDRRERYRGSSALPDRRSSCGRRDTDRYWHP